MKQIEAGLIFDSWKDSLPELRGDSGEHRHPGESTGKRHLIYEGGGVLLDLQVEVSSGNSGEEILRIDGQVLPADDAEFGVSGVPVVLEGAFNDQQASNDQQACNLQPGSLQTTTSALGEFAFREVLAGNPGDWRLSVLLDGRRLMIRGLPFSEPSQWQVVTTMASEKTAKRSVR